MTRYLLDTNIVSHFTKPRAPDRLADWMAEQDDDDLFLSVQTIGEIWHGLLIMPAGARRNTLQTWFSGHEGPQARFPGRILAYSLEAATQWAELMAQGRASGQTRSAIDMIIAATALVNDCVLVTDNERDFAGVVEVINPVRNAISY